MATVPQTSFQAAAIALRGAGVLPFLHNILTCNVDGLGLGETVYGALLSPQGKILHDVYVIARSDGADIVCAADQGEALISKLRLYRLRAKFDIAPLDNTPAFKGALSDDSRYESGIASSAEIGSGKLFPHEANLDLLGAVDFKKGCYVGQEVVSRMQHRGTVRSRILPVTFRDDQYTDDIRVNDQLIGDILGRRGNRALALIKLDRWEELGAPAGVTITKSDWMKL